MATLPINLSEVQRAPVFTKVRQSPPLDLRKSYDESRIRGKHVVITGGASGFGASMAQRWANVGASIVVADVNATRAEATVAQIRKATGNEMVWFVKCDVRSWEEQAALFKEAVKLSPHGGIDIVVANAGVAGPDDFLEQLVRGDEPKKPNLATVDINLTGVLYTSYLAIHYLGKNPGSKEVDSPSASTSGRDRHLLLLGSVASLAPLAGGPLYGASKHGVLGLFRSLRSSAMLAGIRVNMLCPYFIMTDIVPLPAKLMLAGGGTGSVEGVVEGATRLTADTDIRGRALVIGPKAKIRQGDNGDWQLVALSHATGSKIRKVDGPLTNGGSGDVLETELWEAYADDFEDSEIFTLRLISLLNAVTAVKGWAGWARDMVGTFLAPIRKVLGA